MANDPRTLADLGLTKLYEASSGFPMEDTDGMPDDPADYAILATHYEDGYSWYAVRGPSGQLDVASDEGRMYREALSDPDDLPGWIASNTAP
jgi:hypothetical protein